MKKPFGIIYRATNPINGKCYIGQSMKGLRARKGEHIRCVKRGDYPTIYFYNSLKKYGWEKFQWDILCSCYSKEVLDIMETFYIIVYKSHMSENGYNMSWGGEGWYGCHHTQETKDKLSLLRKGKKITPEHIENIRLGQIGKKHSEETKKIMSDNQTREKNSFYGKKHSEENRQKLSEKGLKYIPSEETRKKISVSKTSHTLSIETKEKLSLPKLRYEPFLNDAIHMKSNGYTYAEISRHIGCSVWVISKWRKLGLL